MITRTVWQGAIVTNDWHSSTSHVLSIKKSSQTFIVCLPTVNFLYIRERTRTRLEENIVTLLPKSVEEVRYNYLCEAPRIIFYLQPRTDTI